MTTLHRRQHPPYIAHGLDHQGRLEVPAEACTDMGVEPDDLACASGIVRAVMWALAIWFVGLVAGLAVLWPVAP